MQNLFFIKKRRKWVEIKQSECKDLREVKRRSWENEKNKKHDVV